MQDGNEAMPSILHVPITDERPWVVFAACRDHDAELFFPETPEQEATALAICRGCPVRQECLEWAIEARERYGVWGGTTEKERRRWFRRSA